MERCDKDSLHITCFLMQVSLESNRYSVCIFCLPFILSDDLTDLRSFTTPICRIFTNLPWRI